jgi:hypothetical protein
MSRPLSKGRAPKKDRPHIPSEKKAGSKLGFIALVIILAGIPFYLGKYFELNSPDPFDSGANVYSAEHILKGAQIGVDEKPSADLGTLLVNILGVWLLGFNETGPKLLQGLFQLAALIFMFVSLRRLFGFLAAAVSAVVASFYLSAPLIAKFGNVKEQFMIAFMVIGVSCFVLGQLSGRGFWNVLSGAFLVWAPLFKPTGLSAAAAVGLFVVAQPFLKNRTFRQTFVDIGLLALGAAAALAPVYVWIIGWDVRMSVPYSFVWDIVKSVFHSSAGGAEAQGSMSYVSEGRSLVPFSQQWPRVLRYYGLLILPISLAGASVIARIVRLFVGRSDKSAAKLSADYDRFVLMLAVWWVLDMAFVWVSPRSYEQYYLPLNASGAMLGGYIVALYYDKVGAMAMQRRWIVVGLAALACMIAMSWHILRHRDQPIHGPEVRRESERLLADL